MKHNIASSSESVTLGKPMLNGESQMRPDTEDDIKRSDGGKQTAEVNSKVKLEKPVCGHRG